MNLGAPAAFQLRAAALAPTDSLEVIVMSSCTNRFFLVMAALTMSLGAHAQSAPNGGASARYESERAACASISEPESRSACLREAAAARAEMQRGQLAGESDYQRNALARCQLLPASDQELCRRRMLDQGTVSGSVSDGGIYREYREITLPDAAPAPGSTQR
jgi:hypothetical protein